MTVLLIPFYIFAAFCAGFIWLIMNMNHPLFRNDEGDITSEVGYEEDAVGHRVDCDGEVITGQHEPHVLNGVSSKSGII